eukprot:353813-Rhodomonas_salina.2
MAVSSSWTVMALAASTHVYWTCSWKSTGVSGTARAVRLESTCGQTSGAHRLSCRSLQSSHVASKARAALQLAFSLLCLTYPSSPASPDSRHTSVADRYPRLQPTETVSRWNTPPPAPPALQPSLCGPKKVEAWGRFSGGIAQGTRTHSIAASHLHSPHRVRYQRACSQRTSASAVPFCTARNPAWHVTLSTRCHSTPPVAFHDAAPRSSASEKAGHTIAVHAPTAPYTPSAHLTLKVLVSALPTQRAAPSTRNPASHRTDNAPPWLRAPGPVSHVTADLCRAVECPTDQCVPNWVHVRVGSEVRVRLTPHGVALDSRLEPASWHAFGSKRLPESARIVASGLSRRHRARMLDAGVPDAVAHRPGQYQAAHRSIRVRVVPRRVSATLSAEALYEDISGSTACYVSTERVARGADTCVTLRGNLGERVGAGGVSRGGSAVGEGEGRGAIACRTLHADRRSMVHPEPFLHPKVPRPRAPEPIGAIGRSEHFAPAACVDAGPELESPRAVDDCTRGRCARARGWLAGHVGPEHPVHAAHAPPSLARARPHDLVPEVALHLVQVVPLAESVPGSQYHAQSLVPGSGPRGTVRTARRTGSGRRR